jgi:hypothetical protein
MFLGMWNITQLFSKLKNNVQSAVAGEGHRLDEPSSSSSVSQNMQSQSARRQNSASETATRAAANAAHERLQQQLSKQQLEGSSENE